MWAWAAREEINTTVLVSDEIYFVVTISYCFVLLPGMVTCNHCQFDPHLKTCVPFLWFCTRPLSLSPFPSWYPFWECGQWTSSTDESLVARLFIGFFAIPVYLHKPSQTAMKDYVELVHIVLGHTPHFSSEIFTHSKCTRPGTCFQHPTETSLVLFTPGNGLN